jgi:hypothetical protein
MMPPFILGEATLEALGQIEPTPLVEIGGQGAQDAVQDARAYPELAAPMTSLKGRREPPFFTLERLNPASEKGYKKNH